MNSSQVLLWKRKEKTKGLIQVCPVLGMVGLADRPEAAMHDGNLHLLLSLLRKVVLEVCHKTLGGGNGSIALFGDRDNLDGFADGFMESVQIEATVDIGNFANDTTGTILILIDIDRVLVVVDVIDLD